MRTAGGVSRCSADNDSFKKENRSYFPNVKVVER